MAKKVLVTGGTRSGKSAFAEQLAQKLAASSEGNVEYVATARPRPEDPEWVARIQKHRDRRPKDWITVETSDLQEVLAKPGKEVVLVDCLGVWLTQQMDDHGVWEEDPASREKVAYECENLAKSLAVSDRQVILVTSEVGFSLVPDYPSGRYFQDQLGGLNQLIANECDEVYLCVAGQPVKIKDNQQPNFSFLAE